MSNGLPGASTLFPSGQARQGYPRNWGNYISQATLPNGSGNALNANQFPKLEVGDSAWVIGGTEYLCTSIGTAGGADATWAPSPIGPAAGTTDKALVRWNGTTGSALQNGVALETDLGEIKAGDGTNALPAFSFVSDPDTGAYRIGANQYGIASGGVLVLTATSQTAGTGATIAIVDSTRTGGAGVSQIGVSVAHTLNQTGTAAFTTLDLSQTVTAAGSGAQLFINAKAGAAGATQVFSVSSAGAVRATGNGAPMAYAFISDATKGMYDAGANLVGIGIAGASLAVFNASGMRFSAAASVGINTATANLSTWIAGNITTSNNPSVLLYNLTSASAVQAFTGGAGAAQIAVQIPASVNQTGTAAFTAFDISTTETAPGSGAQLLINAKAGAGGATAEFQVTNKGGIQVAVVTPAQLANGNIDDYAGMAGYSFARLTPDGIASTIRGILAPVPVLGRILTIVNLGNGAGTLTINNQDAGSAAANRIQTTTGAATVIATNGVVRLQYDQTSAFWRQI